MSDDFQRVKSAVNLLQVITQETGLAMKGKHLEQCPFCNHRECFSISPEKGLYHCFSGSCGGEGGDIFTFLQKYKQLSEVESLKYAAQLAGIELEERKPKEEKKLSDKERIYLAALEHFRSTIAPEDSPGRAWFCKTRGHSLATLERLKVGWSKADVLEHLKKLGFSEASVIKCGLGSDERAGKPADPHDAFWKAGVAIFPVFDHAGGIITFTAKDPDKQMKNTQVKGVTKNWFLNHAALGKYDELFLLEGENDKASMIDAGFTNVIASAGQPGKEQYQPLRNHMEGRTLVLWYDQDKQKDFKKETGGPAHIRKIYTALKDDNIRVKIITHPLVMKKNGEPAKDPDDYIQYLFQSGKTAAEVRQEVKDLVSRAQEPIGWEISRLASIEDPKDRLLMFKERGLARMIHEVPGSAERELYIDQAAKTIAISVKATEELVRNAVADLLSMLDDAYHSDIKKADPRRLADRIFQWFSNGAGARIYKTKDGKVWIYYNRRNYEIGNNLEFNTLMDQLTHLSAISKPGNEVWYYLQTLANTHGELVDIMSWLHTDRERDIIYVNLNSEHNKILMLAPGQEPKMIENGTNEHSVLLAPSYQIHPFTYKSSTGEAEGFSHLKTLLMDTTPAEITQRYFSVCWMLSIFLMNYQTDRGLFQVIGSSKTGKSKVPERWSNLLYGESLVGKGTGAAETRLATNNPLVILDNLENRNLLQGTVDFMLFMANSAHKPKAKSGSDTEVLFQKLNAMCIITSIEAFPGKLPELVNRTWPLMLEQEFKQKEYMHDETMRQIKKFRNEILSEIFRLIGLKILPHLERRKFWSGYLQSKHAGHNKDRNNEHLCTIILVLEALLEYLPIPNSPDPVEKQATKIVDQWIEYHEEQARDTESTSNSLLGAIEGLANEIITKIRGRSGRNYEKREEAEQPVYVYEDPEYRQVFLLTEPKDEVLEPNKKMPFDEKEVSCQRLEFVLDTRKLDEIIQRYCSNISKKNPFENATALSYRIRDSRPVLEDDGWSIIGNFKKIGNTRYWKFSKLIKELPR